MIHESKNVVTCLSLFLTLGEERKTRFKSRNLRHLTLSSHDRLMI